MNSGDFKKLMNFMVARNKKTPKIWSWKLTESQKTLILEFDNGRLEKIPVKNITAA